jgi:hypothetical protein
MPATTHLQLYRWTVNGPNDDGDYEIEDHEGDVVDEVSTLDDAIQVCTERATESYRERLWDAITGTDVDGFPLFTLQAIAEMLGHTAESL